MAEERKSRMKLAKKGLDTLKPLDVYDLGGEKDPCFGKLYDLKAEECNNCGDSEFCAIMFAQHMSTTRKQLSKENKFLDEAEADFLDKKDQLREKRMLKLIEQYKVDKLPASRVIKKLTLKFKNTPLYKIEEIVNKQFNK